MGTCEQVTTRKLNALSWHVHAYHLISEKFSGSNFAFKAREAKLMAEKT